MADVQATAEKAGLSPWNVLKLLARHGAGERLVQLRRDFKVSNSTIGRWAQKWSDEGRRFGELTEGYRQSLKRVHDDVMAVANVSHETHRDAMALARAQLPDAQQAMVSRTQALEDRVRQLESTVCQEWDKMNGVCQ